MLCAVGWGCQKHDCAAHSSFDFLPPHSQLDLVLVSKVGRFDSLRRPHFLCSHFSSSHCLLSEENCTTRDDPKGIFSSKVQKRQWIWNLLKKLQARYFLSYREKENWRWTVAITLPTNTAEDRLFFCIAFLFKWCYSFMSQMLTVQ